jgi:predicted ATPase/DNA-binding CsgD family transcriptional regulator
LTRFFGREREAAALVALLEDDRVVTLVGAPGAGKTRLALEVGGRLGGRFAGAVRFVELAPISDPDSVVHAVGSALGIPEEPGRPTEDVLVAALGAAGPVLVILDNCEHVVHAAAALADRLVLGCPSVTVLATSRTPLGAAGERMWHVPPLDLPSAVDLFVDRATWASGGTAIAPGDEPVVEAICTRLDCLPLAVELTAAWSRVLSPDQVLAQVTGAFPDRVVPDRGREARHETMAGAVDWSHRLLPPDAQRLFRQVSVFAGGFDLPALTAIAEPGEAVLPLLAVLVDHSLVVAERVGGSPMRYRVLEPVRQFAEAALVANGEDDKVRRRHFDHYVDLAESYDPWELSVGVEPIPLEQLAREDGNLLAAFEWARHGPSDLALRLGVAATMYWAYGGQVGHGMRRLDDLIATGTDDRQLLAHALSGAGLLTWRWGDYGTARRRIVSALELVSAAEDPLFHARTLLRLAPVESSAGQLEEAARCSNEAIAIYRSAADSPGGSYARAELGIAIARITLAWTRYFDDSATGGDEHMRAALEANERFGNACVDAYAHLGLQYGRLLNRDVGARSVHLEAALDAIERGGIVERSDWLGMAACVAVVQGRFHSALRLSGGAETWGRRRQARPPMPPGSPVAALIAQPFEEVSTAIAIDLLAQGERMAWDELIAEAVAASAADRSALTPREAGIAELVAQGMTNGAIAQHLVISRRTVESHIDHIKQKLGLRSRHEIIVWLLQAAKAPGRDNAPD